jgi:8-oxo-dGTP pyrophosphatase MutT (NUDIX family)
MDSGVITVRQSSKRPTGKIVSKTTTNEPGMAKCKKCGRECPAKFDTCKRCTKPSKDRGMHLFSFVITGREIYYGIIRERDDKQPNFPGGKMLPNECVRSTLVRELKEEMGSLAPAIPLNFTYLSSKSRVGNKVCNYLPMNTYYTGLEYLTEDQIRRSDCARWTLRVIKHFYNHMHLFSWTQGLQPTGVSQIEENNCGVPFRRVVVSQINGTHGEVTNSDDFDCIQLPPTGPISSDDSSFTVTSEPIEVSGSAQGASKYQVSQINGSHGEYTGLDDMPLRWTGSITAGILPAATTSTTLATGLRVSTKDVLLAQLSSPTVTLVAATAAGTYGAIYLKDNATPINNNWNGSWDPSLYWPIAFFYATSAIAGNIISIAQTSAYEPSHCGFNSSNASLMMSYTTDGTTATPSATASFYGVVTTDSSMQSTTPSDVNVVGFSSLDNPMWVSDVNPNGPPIATVIVEQTQRFPAKVTVVEATKYLPSLKRLLSCGDSNIIDLKKYSMYLRIVESACSRGDEEALCEAWNHLMHTINGNTQQLNANAKPYHPMGIWKMEIHKMTPFDQLNEKNIEEAIIASLADLKDESTCWGRNIVDELTYPLLPHADGFRERVTKDKVEQATNKVGKRSENSKDLRQDSPQQVKQRDDLALAKQLDQVATRVAKKIKGWDHLVRWLLRGDVVPEHLALKVYERVCDLNTKWCCDSDFWIAEGICKRRSNSTIFSGLEEWSTNLRMLSKSKAYQDWKSKRFPTIESRASIASKISVLATEADKAKVLQTLRDPIPPLKGAKELEGSFNAYGNTQRDGHSEWLQRTNNKRTRASNGNTDTTAAWQFPNSMSEIESLPSMRPQLEENGTPAGGLVDPVREVALLTGLLGPQGITMSDVPRETALRGATISTANAVTLLNDLNKPECLTYPLTVRNGVAAALVNQLIRPSLYGVGLVRLPACYESTLSSEGLQVQEATMKVGGIRPDQLTSLGLRTDDASAWIRLGPTKDGDSIVSWLLKLWLYIFSRGWAVDASFLPLGSEPGMLDQYTQLDVNPVVALGYNNATVFGADCGGPTSQFPYIDGGLDPQFAVICDTRTAPTDALIYFAPPGLLIQNDKGEPELNLALLLMCITNYPCGMHSVLVSTADTTGGNLDAQEYLLNSDLIHIPGDGQTIYILVPNKYASSPAGNQAWANDLALIRPKTGPTASTGLAASIFLNVSFVNNVTTYSIAQFLYTWMALPLSPIDLTTLTRFQKVLCQIANRSKDLRFSWELACCLCGRYPAMNESLDGTSTLFTQNTAPMVASQNFMALKPHIMTADYPEAQDAFDFYLPSVNPLWWNKIASQLFTTSPDSTDMPPKNTSYDGSPRILQYLIHVVRDYATTSEYMFLYHQLPTEVWNAAFQQLNFTAILEMLRGYFSQSQRGTENTHLVAQNGYMMAVLHSRINRNRPADDMFGYTIWDYINAPRVGFQGVLSIAGVELNTPIPSILADIWVQFESELNTLATTPMLSSNKLLTGVRDEGSQVVPLGAGGYTIPIPIDMQPRAVALDSIPLLVDKMTFNSKLVWHTFTSSLYTLDGNVYATSTIASGNRVVQRKVVADWTVPNLLVSSTLTAKTAWMPIMTLTGLRVAVGVSAANNANLMTQIMAKKTTTGVATWLVRGAHAMPNTIVEGGGGNKQSRLIQRPNPKNSSGSSGPASDAGEVMSK